MLLMFAWQELCFTIASKRLLSPEFIAKTISSAGLMAPLYFKKAVDALATQTHVAAQAAVMALLWSGGCRIVNGLAKELQHPIFTPVAQARPHSCIALHSADTRCQSCRMPVPHSAICSTTAAATCPGTQHANTPQHCFCCRDPCCVTSCQCFAVVMNHFTLSTTVVGR